MAMTDYYTRAAIPEIVAAIKPAVDAAKNKLQYQCTQLNLFQIDLSYIVDYTRQYKMLYVVYNRHRGVYES